MPCPRRRTPLETPAQARKTARIPAKSGGILQKPRETSEKHGTFDTFFLPFVMYERTLMASSPFMTRQRGSVRFGPKPGAPGRPGEPSTTVTHRDGLAVSPGLMMSNLAVWPVRAHIGPRRFRLTLATLRPTLRPSGSAVLLLICLGVFILDLVSRFATSGCACGYWCTWWAQCDLAASQAPRRADGKPDASRYDVADVATWARDSITEDALFRSPGWAVQQYADIRDQLYLVIDDGWDVPFNVNAQTERWQFGSHALELSRFPSFAGNPSERLDALNEVIQRLGWRGLGVWVAAQAVGEGDEGKKLSPEEAHDYWRARLQWSAGSGVNYWKVDWGHHMPSIDFRRQLTQWAHEISSDMVIEHAAGGGPGPFNDIRIDEVACDVSGSGRFDVDPDRTAHWCELVSTSDVFRTYDVAGELGVPTTLDRIAAVLAHARPPRGGAKALLNCEDEVYLGAALGCALGVMRFERWGGESEPSRLMEVERAAGWQRIARPFAVEPGQAAMSDRVLTDCTTLTDDDIWSPQRAGITVRQSAPAIVMRNLALPEVRCKDEPPWVVGAAYSNGAVALAALPRRLQADQPARTPLAQVSLELPAGAGRRMPIALFGHFAAVSLHVPDLPADGPILAQDLASGAAEDIAPRVERSHHTLTITQPVIEHLTREIASDASDPGIVLWWGGR